MKLSNAEISLLSVISLRVGKIPSDILWKIINEQHPSKNLIIVLKVMFGETLTSAEKKQEASAKNVVKVYENWKDSLREQAQVRGRNLLSQYRMAKKALEVHEAEHGKVKRHGNQK